MKKISPLTILSGILLAVCISLWGCSSGGGDTRYTISGTITAPSNTAVDSDINEINVTPKSNNYFDGHSAQTIQKNPVVIGGYANVEGAGEFGNSYETGDRSDVFKVALTENQSVNLYIADYNNADPGFVDLDLYLYAEDVDPMDPVSIAASTGTDASETLQAPAAGTYYIEVWAHSGASNYTLTTGQFIGEATAMDPRLEEDFMPGHVVVTFRRQAVENVRRSLQARDDGLWGLTPHSGTPDDEMVLALTADNRQRVFEALNIEPAATNRFLFQVDDERTQLKLDTLRTIDALKKRGDVLTAEPNYMRYALETPGDTYYSYQWHYPLIHLPQAWEITSGSPDVIVAVIDTRILQKHPDIDATRLVDGYDFISDTSISLDGNGIDPNPEDPGDDMQGGSSFHGTHVAGTVGAATGNGKGVAGVTWGCRIMPLRVLGNGGGLASDIRQAIKYAAGLDNSSGTKPAQRADIINMSLGGASYSETDQAVIDQARAKGVIIIAAAGNSASSSPSYPAAYNGVVSVSSVGPDKTLAPYSNYGSSIDLAAPGGDTSGDLDGDGHPDGVLSTGGDDTSGSIEYVYNFKQGTSMAAPHVAGVAALMASVYPDLSPDIMDTLIREGHITEDLGPVGRDNRYGYGLIDALQAVVVAQQWAGGDIPPFLFVDPMTVNFGSTDTERLLEAMNYSDEPITEVVVSYDAPWLSVAAGGPDPEAPYSVETYTLAVDRDGLADGPYAATVTLEAYADTVLVNTVKVAVRMLVGQDTVSGNAGYHYVVLLDPYTFTLLAQYDVPAPTNGAYRYRLQAPPGDYIIFAGTDADNDYFIGDPGESSGAYISLDQPLVVRLTRDLTGYDFSTSFNLNLPSSLSVARDGAFQPVRIRGAEGIRK